MTNLLSRIKERVTCSMSNWYSERRLRSLFAYEIRNGTATIERNEKGRPYVSIKREQKSDGSV
jgi:hypothetical protein